MKKTIQILLGGVLLGLSATSAAASGEPASSPVTPSEVQALTAPEPGAQPADYQAKEVTLRLLGTQGEGAAASATFTDTATWHTQTYRVGESIGRNLKVAAVHATSIELAGSAASTVAAGADVRVRLIEHEFDTAAADQGQHQWAVKAAAMARLVARHGMGATATPVEYGGQPAFKVGVVQPGSALFRLGFARGDLIFELNGQPATATSLATLASEVTQKKNQVLTVKMGRGGSQWERAYVVE